jgi:hypothetical protein
MPSASYLRTPADEVVDQQLVSIDLVDLAETSLPQDFNLSSEVQKVRPAYRVTRTVCEKCSSTHPIVLLIHYFSVAKSSPILGLLL